MNIPEGQKYDILFKIFKNANEKFCFHKDQDCSRTISNCHSIQNYSVLKKISFQGHAYAFGIDIINPIFKMKFDNRGINKVTTFNGFCNYHDNNILKDI